MEYGKYETLARAGYSGAARPQGDWQTSAALTRRLANQIFAPRGKAG